MRRGVALLLVALVLVGLAAWWLGNGAKFGKTRSQQERNRVVGPGFSKPPVLDISRVYLESAYNNGPFDFSYYVPANDSIGRWWDSLPAVPASQLQEYINSLWRIADGKGNYTGVFNSQYWEAPPKPLPNETVKVASWRLWCGARLDMIAYVDPKTGITDVVIYGTIENMTEYRYCMGLALAVGDEHGFLPGFAWGLGHGYTTQEFVYSAYLSDGLSIFNITSATYLWRITLYSMGYAVYDWEKTIYHINFTVKPNGEIWGYVYSNGKEVMELEYPNITYFKSDTGLDHVPNSTTVTLYKYHHPINVYILLEEPVLSIYVPLKGEGLHPYYYAYPGVEATWWTLVGYPAFSLAANLRWHGANITREYTRIAEWAAETARQVVLYQVSHPGNNPANWAFPPQVAIPPSTLRYEGLGVCSEQSSATQLFVSTALGLPTVYWVGDNNNHAISYVLVPSKIVANGENLDKLHGDYDGDGKPDHAVVIIDTAKLTPQERYQYTTLEQAYPPLGFKLYKNEEYLDRDVGLNPLLLEYVESLPAPLRAPWQELAYNITGVRYVANGIPPYTFHAELNLTKYVNMINSRLWLDKDHIDLPYYQQLPLNIYDRTPQEILQEINDKIPQAAKAWLTVLAKDGYNLTTATLLTASSNNIPQWGGKYGTIHVPLTVAAQVYALALQHYHWTTTSIPAPAQPQPLPGSIQQAVNHLPKQLNQWNK